MAYEVLIGWRYVYRGLHSRAAVIGFVVCGALAILGSALMLAKGWLPVGLPWTGNAWTGVGAILLMSTTLPAILFGLLYFFSVFTTVAVLGVVLGVGALTMVLAITTGFQEEFQNKVLGVNAHVIIMKNTNDFRDYNRVEEIARQIDDDVLAVEPFIFVEMLVRAGTGKESEVASGVTIKGVDPQRVTEVLDLEKHMLDGAKVSSLGEKRIEGRDPGRPRRPAPIILGRELAQKLKVDVGDEVVVVAPTASFEFDGRAPASQPPRTRKFRISGIFYSGFDEYDRRLMYISLDEAQVLLGRPDQVLGVELKVRDVTRAKEISDKLKEVLGESYMVQDWHELNRNLFRALMVQKVVLTVILTLIIIVATFNMVSALTMMVIDKTREIAILMSMGSRSTSIARVFQVVGLVIGGLGTAIGLAVGLTLSVVLEKYGYRLDPRVYLIDRLPISIHAIEVVAVAALTMAICSVATLLPSAKASALRPVEGLRYD